MIQLFDYYGQESRDLHASMTLAGLSETTIVIEPDGFLPDDVVSPFTYFLCYHTGKPLFFNQVPVPDFWEITGNNQFGKINNLTEEKAHIHFADGRQARLVRQVDWLDKQGRLSQVDHYNRYGACFAKTSYGNDGQAIFTRYFSVDGKERLLENHVTGDILLTLEGEGIRHFSNRVAFVHYFLQHLGVDLSTIVFNTLSTSFLVSFHFPEKKGTDVLVWQEPLFDSIPGNMQLILENDDIRAKKIVIPNQETYERALELVDSRYHHKLTTIGYHYEFKRDNFVRRDALIVTNSDQIEGLETLVEALPDVRFRIAAVTEMSPKLMDMIRYSNVVLYQNASPQQIESLYQMSDIYLDINYGDELLNAVRVAFEHNLLVIAFRETGHNFAYTASEHVFEKTEVSHMVELIQQAVSGVDGMKVALAAQGLHANYTDLESYREAWTNILGESHA